MQTEVAQCIDILAVSLTGQMLGEIFFFEHGKRGEHIRPESARASTIEALEGEESE